VIFKSKPFQDDCQRHKQPNIMILKDIKTPGCQ
jgi:hypothetical protein